MNNPQKIYFFFYFLLFAINEYRLNVYWTHGMQPILEHNFSVFFILRGAADIY